jgi:endonuclease/exonuclease/phosphatase family metal-dependent hydrolase
VLCRDTNYCQAADRQALLARQLEAAKCPEVVGLQEINLNHAKLLKKLRKTICNGRYKIAIKAPKNALDTEQVLTTLPVKSTKVIHLTGNFRTATRVVLKASFGTLVVVVTHQEGDPDPGTPLPGCTGKGCRPPCKEGTNAYACQTIAAEVLGLKVGGPKAVRVLMGDFNVTYTSPRYKGLIADGWVDSFLASGNAECVPLTGVDCTSGREDQKVEALKDPTAKESERIDFIFVKPPTGCKLAFDPLADSDGDGLGTGLFAAAPAVNGPGGIVWTSDHTGVSADFSCTKA